MKYVCVVIEPNILICLSPKQTNKNIFCWHANEMKQSVNWFTSKQALKSPLFQYLHCNRYFNP